METSSSTFYPLCPTAYNALNHDKYIPCSSNLKSYEHNIELRQDSEVIHGEIDNNKIIENPFHSLQFPIFHEEKCSIQVSYEISSIYTSLDFLLKESYDLSIFFVEIGKYDQSSGVDGYHLNNSDFVEINNSSFPHTM